MTRQKLRTIAIQRSECKRAEFMADISLFDPDMLVWLGQTREIPFKAMVMGLEV